MAYYFTCPNCGGNEQFHTVKQAPDSVGCVMFLLGWWIPALLHASAMSGRIQCGKCGYLFRQPAYPRTPVSRLAIWIIGILVVCALWTSALVLFPDVAADLPAQPVTDWLERLVVQHPKAIVWGLFPMGLLIGLAALIASWISAGKAIATLKGQYETRPTPRPDPPASPDEAQAGKV